MAIVYSYIRFSSKKQAQGSSLDRQLEGEEWIERNGHTKADIEPLHDLGVSAFRGKNRHVGKLKEFLDLVEAGEVPKGSILLIEHLDRLSREGVYEALPIWLQILNAGVKIAVLKPEEHVYSKEDDPNAAMISIMLPLVYFYLAHVESHRKSRNLIDVWERKRRKARKDKTPLNRRRPSWVSWNEEMEKFELNDGAKAVKFMIQQSIDGHGQRYILKKLHDQFPPIGTSGNWNGSFVQSVLSDRAITGEFQPYKFNDDGDRIKDGLPISDYYPRLIDESEWYRLQASKEERKRAKGPSSQFMNIFDGLLRNAHDGHAMHIQKSRAIRAGEEVPVRRLVSYGAIRQIERTDKVGVPLDQFEQAVLWRLSEIDPADLLPKKRNENTLDDLNQELRGVEQRYQEIERILIDPDSKQKPAALSIGLSKLEQTRTALKAQIERQKIKQSPRASLGQVKSVTQMLAAAKNQDEIHELRTRLRARIASILDVIILKPEKHFGRVWVAVQICFGEQYLGGIKHLAFGPEYLSDSLPIEIDLESRREAQTTLFAEIAKERAEPEAFIFDGVLPKHLGDAAGVWLAIAKSSMAKDSYRVVPSKIHRFVEVLGPKLKVSEITERRWNRWAKSLQVAIDDGSLKPSTARVSYSRAREMVRWFIELDEATSFPSLKKSARAALEP